jgi:hypothetical protein
MFNFFSLKVFDISVKRLDSITQLLIYEPDFIDESQNSNLKGFLKVCTQEIVTTEKISKIDIKNVSSTDTDSLLDKLK